MGTHVPIASALSAPVGSGVLLENVMHITGIGYDNQPWLLVEKESQRLVQRGEILKDFRGETLRIVGGSAPHKPSSTGRIRTGEDQTFYPSVVGCVWIKV